MFHAQPFPVVHPENGDAKRDGKVGRRGGNTAWGLLFIISASHGEAYCMLRSFSFAICFFPNLLKKSLFLLLSHDAVAARQP